MTPMCSIFLPFVLPRSQSFSSDHLLVHALCPTRNISGHNHGFNTHVVKRWHGFFLRWLLWPQIYRRDSYHLVAMGNTPMLTGQLYFETGPNGSRPLASSLLPYWRITLVGNHTWVLTSVPPFNYFSNRKPLAACGVFMSTTA
jgi:hypothetical protein